MMHLLVTRPEADAHEVKSRLEALGHRVSLAPLLAAEFDTAKKIDLDQVQALVATSRNGVRALVQSPALEAALCLPFFAVGPATGEAARQAGFARVIEGPAGAADLVPVIAASTKPGDGPLLHLSGEQLAFDLKGALAGRGFELRQAILYRMRAATALPPEVADAIRTGALDGALFMSRRTAETFARLVAEAGIAEEARQLTYFCMSPAVAEALAPIEPVNVNIAGQPKLEEMLALAARLAPESR